MFFKNNKKIPHTPGVFLKIDAKKIKRTCASCSPLHLLVSNACSLCLRHRIMKLEATQESGFDLKDLRFEPDGFQEINYEVAGGHPTPRCLVLLCKKNVTIK